MKRKKIQSIKQVRSISNRHKAIAIWIFTLLLVSAFFLPSNAISKTTITWEPNVLYNTIGNGQVAQDLYVKFVSTKNLTDVSVWAVPELQPFIIVSPEIFPQIQAGTQYELRIQFRIPPAAVERIYEGVIQLRSGSKVIPLPLPVNLDLNYAGIAISPNARVLPETTIQQIINISENAIEFNTVTPFLQDISPGDILIFGVTNFTPNGLICKIADIDILPDKVILLFGSGSLTEAFEKVTVDLSMDLTQENLATFVSSRPGVSMLQATQESDDGFYFEISTAIFDEDGDPETSNDQIKAKGSVFIDPGFDLFLDIDNWTLKQLTFVNRIEEKSNLEIRAAVNFLDYDTKVEIFRHYFSPVTVWAGWVPIVFTPVLTVNVGFDGEIYAGITSEVTQTATFAAGLSYDAAGWGLISDFDIDFDFEPLNPTLGCDFKGYVGPQFNLLVYGLVGPYSEVVAFLELEADLFDSPPWELYAGLEVGAGVRVEALSHEIVDYYEPGVIGYRRLLAQGTAENGQIDGIVRDAVTRDGLAGVYIQIFNDSALVASDFSDTDGTFSLEVAAGADYRVEFSKNGYLETYYYNVDISSDETTYLETVLQIDENHSGAGNVSGSVVNALNGAGISGLNIALREGINVRTGSIIEETQSGASGAYSFTNISAGTYTAEVYGTQYNTGYFTVICIGGTTTSGQNFAVTPVLPAGETRIILTWDLNPRDLDSHLTGPLPDGSRFHMYFPYANSNSGSPWPEYVMLDLDDVTSYGPETNTIIQQIEGAYRFSVHDYTNRSSTSSSALSNSGAQVRVYRGSDYVASFNVPTNQGGTLWTVFELSGDTISPINQLSYTSSPSGIQNVQQVRSPLIETDALLFDNLPEK